MANEKEFYFIAKDEFKPINLTKIDKKIRSISINVPDDFEVSNYPSLNINFDSFQNSFKKFSRKDIFNQEVFLPKINFDYKDEEYEKFKILENIDIYKPFRYSGINIYDSVNISKPMQLTPVKNWARITCFDDDKFKI